VKPCNDHVPPVNRRIAGFLTCAALCLWAGSVAAEPVGVKPQQDLDAGLAAYVPAKGLSGRVSIAGSDTMAPLMTKLVAHFTHQHPNTKFGVEKVGSAEAIREFLLGISYQRRADKARGRGTEGAAHADLLASSRPLSEKEINGFTFNYGYEPLEVPIAMDAVAIYVNKENPIKGLTLEQVDAIFSATNKRGMPSISTWDQAGVENWNGQPIHLYGRDKKSATRYFFEHVALLGGNLKSDVHEQPGSASEILAIAEDRLGIGYASAGYNTSFVRMVPLAEQKGERYIVPSTESVRDHSYPLARPLFLYVNKNPKGKLDPIVEEFLKFVNSRQGQEIVARANFYPLPNTQVAKNRQNLGLTAALPQDTMTVSRVTSDGVKGSERED
jgi:phosphate transport system substrate-binding protein